MKKLALMLIAVCGTAILGEEASAQDWGNTFRNARSATGQAHYALQQARQSVSYHVLNYALDDAYEYAVDANFYASYAYYDVAAYSPYGPLDAYGTAIYWLVISDYAEWSYDRLVIYIERTQRWNSQLDAALQAAWNAKQKTEAAFQLALLYYQWGIDYQYGL